MVSEGHYRWASARCITIDKMQGSEALTVVLWIGRGPSIHLDRRRLYTGLTRSSLRLWIVACHDPRNIDNRGDLRRRTDLAEIAGREEGRERRTALAYLLRKWE